MNRLCVLALCVMLPACASLDVQRTRDARTGLERVELRDRDLSLRIVPLSRDFVVALLLGRGLPRAVAEATRDYCTFGVTLRNLGDRPLRYRLTDWRFVTPDGHVARVRPKSDWVAQWRRAGIAFRWLLLHEAQSYQPGDWGQGLVTVPLAPGSRFDLYYSWESGGRVYEGRIRDLRCAPADVADVAAAGPGVRGAGP